ncbi:uncharacterized protein LOC135683655 [Rhopilema esculentum]|uniref:uncharacterized protein LOC135683654 n=1 Tax=Rhopilema esculentum TaxID=499914 RepID=UPI0031DE0828
MDEIVCTICKRECGSHWCKICKKPCHSIKPCGKTDGEEGYGSAVICKNCSSSAASNDSSGGAVKSFLQHFKRQPKDSIFEVKPKRVRSGYETTQIAICLKCFQDQKPKFWLSRFNQSTVKKHMETSHGNHNISSKDIVPGNAIAAAEAMRKYSEISKLKISENLKVWKESKPSQKSSTEEGTDVISKVNDSELTASLAEESTFLSKSPMTHLETNEDITKKSDLYQETLESLLPSAVPKQQSIGTDESSFDSVANLIAEKVAKIIQKNGPKTSSSTVDTKLNSSNLNEFLENFPDFKVIKDEGMGHILKCTPCSSFIASPYDKRPPSRRGNISSAGSLATGLTLSFDTYSNLCFGHCQKWFDLKFKLQKHLSSEGHLMALQHAKLLRKGEKRRSLVVKNQLRTALGVVKSKSAALHYETRLAELYAAGVDVGDYGHSRKLFNAMIKATCNYIDMRTKRFLKMPLPNTGMTPHFYVTADKSTNHRIVNQVTMVCLVVDGARQGIPLSMSPVYFNSEGDTGRGSDLAKAVIDDLKKNAGIEEDQWMQVQGRVTDGQYINTPFVAAMNEPIMKAIQTYEDENSVNLSHIKDEFWWPVQWDPAHWLDKVFSAHRNTDFVERLLKRTAQYHQMFKHGKLHTVAKETARELSLPFRVTNSYANQRFMSSSYLSLKNLAISLEAYIESYKDHDNREDLGYKLCGQDFCFDLLGLLDLLWPLVTLMLEGQAQWCPGWKFAGYIPKARDEIIKIMIEIGKESPAKEICKWLGDRGEEIRNMKYGHSNLKVGWLVVEEKKGMPVSWEAREISDCIKDLQDFGDKMLKSLDERFQKSFPKLNQILHECFDFGVLMQGLTGRRSNSKQHPINKSKFASLGMDAFKRCVQFVADLPHVKDKNSELDEQFSFTIFWQLKSTLIEVIWGRLFYSHFPKFFQKVETLDGKVETASLKNDLLDESVFLLQFQQVKPDYFTLADVFEIVLSNGDHFTVSLVENEIIKSLYTDVEFYSLVGQPFCLIFDIMYSKTGTESVVESFYRVVEQQEMDGGQSIAMLGARAKVDWCLPPAIQCEDALKNIAKLYIGGDTEAGLPRHYVPVYSDSSQQKKNLTGLSKVLERVKSQHVKLPFLF